MSTHASKMQMERVSLSQGTLTLLSFNLQKQPYNIYIPDNHQIPLYTSTKADPWYIIITKNTDTQKQGPDEKEFAEIAEKMTTQVPN